MGVSMASPPRRTVTSSSPGVTPPLTATSTTETTKHTTTHQLRPIPPVPTGIITQEIGEAYCKRICDEMFPELFDGKLGQFRGVTADFKLKEGHEKYLKVLPCAKVPHGIRPEFDAEMAKFSKHCIKVDGRGLKVATQVVPVTKIKNGKRKVRICGNYKTTINSHIEDEHHQFTSMNEQVDKLRGEHFTILDNDRAYMQVTVGKGGELLILNTPDGFKQPTRLPFGVKTAPKIF